MRYLLTVLCFIISLHSLAQYRSGNRNDHSLHYNGFLESGYTFGVGEWGQSSFKLDVVNGVKISFYSVGLGVGIRSLNKANFERKRGDMDSTELEDNNVVPIFLDNRIEFFRGKLRPYMSLGFGVSIISGGFSLLGGTTLYTSLFLNSSVGVKWMVSEKISLFAGIAYELFDVHYTEIVKMNGYSYPVTYQKFFKEKSNSLGLTIGIGLTK